VIGVENTTNGITWFDLTRVAIQFGLIGQVGTQIIGNATTALNFLNLRGQERFLGTPLLGYESATPLTMPEDLYVSAKRRSEQDHHPGSFVLDRSADGHAADGRDGPHRHEADLGHRDVDLHRVCKDPAKGIARHRRFDPVLGNGFPTYMVPTALVRFCRLAFDGRGVQNLFRF
jgi:hypothetical protein